MKNKILAFLLICVLSAQFVCCKAEEGALANDALQIKGRKGADRIF